MATLNKTRPTLNADRPSATLAVATLNFALLYIVQVIIPYSALQFRRNSADRQTDTHTHTHTDAGNDNKKRRCISVSSDCALRAPGNKPALWSATGCDIYRHFHRSWVGSDLNATWEFLALISSWYNRMNSFATNYMPSKIGNFQQRIFLSSIFPISHS